MEKIQAAIEKARALRERNQEGVEGLDPAASDADQRDVPVDAPRRDAHLQAMEKARESLAATEKLARERAAAVARDSAPRARQTPPVTGPAEPQSQPNSAPSIVTQPTGPRAPRFHLSDARSVWQDLTAFKPDPARMRRNRIVSYERSDPAHVAYDMMRTRLLQHTRTNGWTTVAITSPGANCGKTTTCLNLAFALAYQQDTRTVVMDVDLRRPQMGKLLGLKEVHSMAAVLEGTGEIDANFVRYGENLAIGTNERPSRHPAELLQNSAAGAALQHLDETLGPDVILFDMPPMMSNDDVMAFVPHVDCVLLVAAAENTSIDDVDRCERELAAQTNVLGVVLNKCRYATDKYGYY